MKTKKLLPKLRKLTKKNKKHIYKLKDPHKKRILAIEEGINYEKRVNKKTKKKAAIAKKGRFNILRIYRRNQTNGDCQKLTTDMRYMDKKYGLGKTKSICKKQKGGGGKKTRRNKNKTIKYSMKPKKINGKIDFPDHPEFKPNLTPREIFKLGSFGGTYWRPIKSTFYKKRLSNQHKKSSSRLTNASCEDC